MTLQKTHIAKPIEDKGFHAPVDIVIPFHGQYELVANLVKSIFRFTFSNYYNIYLVDDCSPNAQFGLALGTLNLVKCIRHTNQQGFGASLKTGFQNGSNSWVVFMHSDCLVEDTNWLKSLGETLLNLKPQGVRMVSPRTNNCVNGDPNILISSSNAKTEDVVLTDSHLPMYCWMAHRELFDKVGGFVQPYPIGGYEDEEFAFRMNRHGYKQGVSGVSWIYHEGEATFKSIRKRNVDMLKIIEANRDRCIEDMRKTT